MAPKSPLLSKTIWFNILAILVLVATHFGFDMQAHTPANSENILAVIILVINIILRFVTTQPIIDR